MWRARVQLAAVACRHSQLDFSGPPCPARGYLDADVTIDAIGEREFTSTPDERRVRRS